MTKKILRVRDAIALVTPIGREFTIKKMMEIFRVRGIEVVDSHGKRFPDANLKVNLSQFLSAGKRRGEFESIGASAYEGRYKRVTETKNVPHASRIPEAVRIKAKVKAERARIRDSVLKEKEPKKKASREVPLEGRATLGMGISDLEEAKGVMRDLLMQEARRRIRASLEASRLAAEHEISELTPRIIEETLAEMVGRSGVSNPGGGGGPVQPTAQTAIEVRNAPVVSVTPSAPAETPRLHVAAPRTASGKPPVAQIIRSDRPLTVPERVAVAMGDRVWDIDSLERALRDAGEEFKTSNLRNYVAAILSGTKVRLTGTDGKDLCKADGSPVEVHKFTFVERSKYRVATVGEKQVEACKLLGSDEVIISKTPRTPADLMFEEQGINSPDIANSN